MKTNKSSKVILKSLWLDFLQIWKNYLLLAKSKFFNPLFLLLTLLFLPIMLLYTICSLICIVFYSIYLFAVWIISIGKHEGYTENILVNLLLFIPKFFLLSIFCPLIIFVFPGVLFSFLSAGFSFPFFVINKIFIKN